MITIVNAKAGINTEDFDLMLYCGRPSSFNRAYNLIGEQLVNLSYLGNPYRNNGKPGSTLPKYQEWLQRQQQRFPVVKETLKRIHKRHELGFRLALVCWCSPHPCHAGVIKQVSK